jgi:hypothetical protein
MTRPFEAAVWAAQEFAAAFLLCCLACQLKSRTIAKLYEKGSTLVRVAAVLQGINVAKGGHACIFCHDDKGCGKYLPHV